MLWEEVRGEWRATTGEFADALAWPGLVMGWLMSGSGWTMSALPPKLDDF
jgi:hypothetical protein